MLRLSWRGQYSFSQTEPCWDLQFIYQSSSFSNRSLSDQMPGIEGRIKYNFRCFSIKRSLVNHYIMIQIFSVKRCEVWIYPHFFKGKICPTCLKLCYPKQQEGAEEVIPLNQRKYRLHYNEINSRSRVSKRDDKRRRALEDHLNGLSNIGRSLSSSQGKGNNEHTIEQGNLTISFVQSMTCNAL